MQHPEKAPDLKVIEAREKCRPKTTCLQTVQRNSRNVGQNESDVNNWSRWRLGGKIIFGNVT